MCSKHLLPLCRTDGSFRKITSRPPKSFTRNSPRRAWHVSSREPRATQRFDLLQPHLPTPFAEKGGALVCRHNEATRTNTTTTDIQNIVKASSIYAVVLGFVGGRFGVSIATGMHVGYTYLVREVGVDLGETYPRNPTLIVHTPEPLVALMTESRKHATYLTRQCK